MAVVTALTCGPDEPFPYDRFMRVLFTQKIEDIQAVTSDEMEMTVDTNDEYCLVDINGWEVNSGVISDPNWGVYLAQRPGELSVQEAVLTYAAVPTGSDIRSLLTRGVRGYILILPAGDEPGAVMNVYPVWVAHARQRQRLREGGALVDVRCAVRRQPAENVTIPAV